jgi:hypothetical protein
VRAVCQAIANAVLVGDLDKARVLADKLRRRSRSR